jgi:hypothetical protein
MGFTFQLFIVPAYSLLIADFFFCNNNREKQLFLKFLLPPTSPLKYKTAAFSPSSTVQQAIQRLTDLCHFVDFLECGYGVFGVVCCCVTMVIVMCDIIGGNQRDVVSLKCISLFSLFMNRKCYLSHTMDGN